MQVRRIESMELVVAHLKGAIANALSQGQRVLWLVSGGSTIEVAVKTRLRLASTSGLTVSQVDERFGPPGHQDSNWRHLLEAGFSCENIRCIPILDGQSLDSTIWDFRKTLRNLFDQADFKLGLFGIGADGHTAGILPGSAAANSADLATAYQGSDFVRLTITPKAMAKLDLAIAFAHSEQKVSVINALSREIPIAEHPVQALKLAKDSYVYYDYR